MKSKGKRLLGISVLCTVLFIFSTITVFAAEDAISYIQIRVLLESDGSAVITEVWDVRGISGGTEYYKALDNMDGMSVHSLRVWNDSGIQYETLDNWDTDLTLQEKAGTCGILKKSDGYELCWGIGSYGNQQYTIEYTLEGLVKDYGDYAGFYHQFISQLSSAPEYAFITIQAANEMLTENNARIWGYGFPGEVEIGNVGILNVFSSEALGSNDYVNVLCRFDRDLFPLASKGDISFEELQESAEQDFSNIILYVLAALAVVIVLAVILITFFSSRYKLADGRSVRLPKRRQIETNWSIPFGGSIPSVYAVMKLLRKGISCEQLMSAYLIRWQEAGYISMETQEKNQGKKSKKEEAIVFVSGKFPDQGAEAALYRMLEAHADQNGILWTSVMEAGAEEIYKMLTKWAEDVQREGEEELIYSNTAQTDIKGVVRFTDSGFKQAVNFLGFQKYLTKMNEPSEDHSASRKLWGDYLVLAALLGIGEQVLKSMKTLDPGYFDTFSSMYGYNAGTMIYLMVMTNHISSAPAPSTDGMGGAAGSIGGGGFSGGGGGGSR